LDICEKPGWKTNIVHKQCSKTNVIPYLSTMMVRSKLPIAWNIAIFLGAQRYNWENWKWNKIVRTQSMEYNSNAMHELEWLKGCNK
jgi:hypothetical protein